MNWDDTRSKSGNLQLYHPGEELQLPEDQFSQCVAGSQTSLLLPFAEYT